MPAKPHRWVPCSVLGPIRGAAPEHQKVCGHPSAPCAAASALRHWPPRRGAAGYGPPLLRGFACRLRRHQRTAPVPVSARLARANAACARPSLRRRPGPPLASLRPSGGSDGSGTRSCGSPLGCFGWACGPPYAPLRVRLRPFCAAASAGPPKTAPSASCPPSSLGRLAAWAGCGLRSSRPGPGAALAVRFLRPPAPGALGRRQMQQRDSGVIQGGFRLIERSLGGGEPPQILPCITLNLICC